VRISSLYYEITLLPHNTQNDEFYFRFTGSEINLPQLYTNFKSQTNKHVNFPKQTIFICSARLISPHSNTGRMLPAAEWAGRLGDGKERAFRLHLMTVDNFEHRRLLGSFVSAILLPLQ
jgi:hypothetical protein